MCARALAWPCARLRASTCARASWCAPTCARPPTSSRAFAPTCLRHRFAKSGEHLAREVETEHVTLEVRVRNVVGEASQTMASDEVLDFTHGPPAGGFEPLRLGCRGCYASELARMGEADGTGLEVAGGFG